MTKIPKAQRSLIAQALKQNMKWKTIMERFGVSKTTVGRIRKQLNQKVDTATTNPKGAAFRMAIETKMCTRCRKTKPVSEFWRRDASKDGRYYRCIACSGMRSDPTRRNKIHRHNYIQSTSIGTVVVLTFEVGTASLSEVLAAAADSYHLVSRGFV